MLAKKGVDAQGIVFLVGLSLLLAFNQIVIKV
ncbi:MAG TPA: EamA/RhaT family transporter, partial [Rhodobacteraceae bacterium]|nr:EamA/RhaT family transporter [Paracoccaceae bacterium]